jgi:hypothetical protein
MFGLSPCELPSSRDLSISNTCPPQMDGSYPLATSSLRDLEYPILGFSTCKLPSSRDHRSLPPVLLRWTALSLLTTSLLAELKDFPFCLPMPEPPRWENLLTRVLHTNGSDLSGYRASRYRGSCYTTFGASTSESPIHDTTCRSDGSCDSGSMALPLLSFKPFGPSRRNLLAPLQDLTILGTSRNLLR